MGRGATPPRKKNYATETMTRDIRTHGTRRDADQETGSMTFSDQSRKEFATQKVDVRMLGHCSRQVN